MAAVSTILHDPSALPPRPAHDAPPGPFLWSDHFRMGDRYHTYRSGGEPTFLLFYTFEGTGFFRSDAGETHFAMPGEIVLYAPRVQQEYGTPPGETWCFHWASFSARPYWAEWLKLPAFSRTWRLRSVRLPSGQVTARVEAAFKDLHVQTRRGDAVGTELSLNCIERVILSAWESALAKHKPVDPRIGTALETIHMSLARPLPIPVLARAAALSPSRFEHLFKLETGQSVLGYLLASRMREAARLLELTPLRVSEIAYQLGYKSPFHFSNQFRRVHGKSPRAFRDALLER
jgi:AraC family transcriptional regulator, arabinose operon regulatory protein